MGLVRAGILAHVFGECRRGEILVGSPLGHPWSWPRIWDLARRVWARAPCDLRTRSRRGLVCIRCLRLPARPRLFCWASLTGVTSQMECWTLLQFGAAANLSSEVAGGIPTGIV